MIGLIGSPCSDAAGDRLAGNSCVEKALGILVELSMKQQCALAVDMATASRAL